MTQKPMHEAKCTSCGKATTVPFKPTPGKPVYCRECFAKKRSSSQPDTNKPKTRPKPSPFESKQAWARRR